MYTSHRIWYSEDLRLAGTEERQSWISAAELEQYSRDVSDFLARSILLNSMITGLISSQLLKFLRKKGLYGWIGQVITLGDIKE